MSYAELRDKIDSIDAQIKELKKQKEELIKETIKCCNHPMESVRHLEYEDHGWLGCSQPWLICLDCGFTEQGWDVSLKSKLRPINRYKCKPITKKLWNKVRTCSLFSDGRVLF